MSRITGTITRTTTLGESVDAFVPFDLPPQNPALETTQFADLLAQTNTAIGRLNAVSGLVHSVDWLVYASLRKEALLTSQIEGTQATLDDLFDAQADIAVDNPQDVEEVVNYLKAFQFVRSHLRDEHGANSLPLCVRLLCEAHALLMHGARGATKQPGSIRQSQNWIGGQRPGNAAFVPPPPHKVPQLLSALERFIHAPSDNNNELAPLIKVALVHVQFGTIHPFLDGNGRIGRLLIAAMLEQYDVLPQPLLYVSAALKRRQLSYYQHLASVRTQGAWEAWIVFFLTTVIEAASESERCIIELATLINNDRKKLLASRTMAHASYRLFEHLPSMPRLTIESAKRVLNASFPTANSAVETLVKLGILQETSGRKKNRSFGYQAYIARLSQ